MNLRESVIEVQKIGKKYDFSVVIVGGAMVRLIGPKTTIKKIDVARKIILLEKAENPGLTRKEDATTTVDIDCIAFSQSEDPFSMDVLEKFSLLKKALRVLQKETAAFPAVSLEAVLYHPYFPKPQQFFQFVSSIESYHAGSFFFRLGNVKQDIKPSSLDIWTYTFTETDQTIISLNPLALQRRYLVRGFSAKPKDKEKIWGEKSAFAAFVAEFDKQTKQQFTKDFLEWDEFASLLQHAKQPSMQVKRGLWDAYWKTIGTYLAHGTGPLGKVLLPLGNTFFAGK